MNKQHFIEIVFVEEIAPVCPIPRRYPGRPADWPSTA